MTRLIRSMRSRARGMLFLEHRSDASREETGGKTGLGQGPRAGGERGVPTETQTGLPRGTGRLALTEPRAHAAGDLQQDAGVAADHDEQGQQEEAGEAHHVVERLVPGPGEAAPRGALREVVRGAQGDGAEQEQLHTREVGWG